MVEAKVFQFRLRLGLFRKMGYFCFYVKLGLPETGDFTDMVEAKVFQFRLRLGP
jgi:hypothetical protein